MAGCATLFVDAFRETQGSTPDPLDVLNTLEATADAYILENVGTGHVDAVGTVERAEAGDSTEFDEVEIVGEGSDVERRLVRPVGAQR